MWFVKMKNSIKYLFIIKNMYFMLNNGILLIGFCGLECNSIVFEYILLFILIFDFEIKKNVILYGVM